MPSLEVVLVARRISTGNSLNQFEGFLELSALFAKLAERAPAVYETELANAANAVANSARASIRSKSGKLISSIKVNKRKFKGSFVYKIAAGGTEAPHGHLVEFGHRLITPQGIHVGDVPPRSFLRKGFEENRDMIEVALNRALDNLLG